MRYFAKKLTTDHPCNTAKALFDFFQKFIIQQKNSKEIAFDKKQDKTAGYHRHILRLPIFAKKAFKKIKTFSRKKHPFFIIFSNFSIVQFLPKNLINRAEQIFLSNNTI